MQVSSQKISWQQWNTKLRTKLLIFFENIWPLQTFYWMIIIEIFSPFLMKLVSPPRMHARESKFFCYINLGNSSRSLFGNGCIFGSKIQITKNYFTVWWRYRDATTLLPLFHGTVLPNCSEEPSCRSICSFSQVTNCHINIHSNT